MRLHTFVFTLFPIGLALAALACSSASDSTREAPAGPDAGVDAESPPDTGTTESSPFVGRWSPIAGQGTTTCSGSVTQLPPDPSAVITLAMSGAHALQATSSNAAGCTLALTVAGDSASLAQSTETCGDPDTGENVDFGTFQMTFVPAGQAAPALRLRAVPDESPSAGDDAGSDAESSASDDGGNDAAIDDAGSPIENDASTNQRDAGEDADDAAAPAQDTVDWQLADTEGNCVTTLHYTLARAK